MIEIGSVRFRLAIQYPRPVVTGSPGQSPDQVGEGDDSTEAGQPDRKNFSGFQVNGGPHRAAPRTSLSANARTSLSPELNLSWTVGPGGWQSRTRWSSLWSNLRTSLRS